VLSDPTVIGWFNNSTPFYAGIILSAINLVILLFALRETHQVYAQQHKGLAQDFYHLIFKNNIHFILLTYFVFELGWSMYYQSLMLLLSQDFHVTNKVIGFFASYVGLLISFFLIYGVRLVVNRFPLTSIVKPSFVIGVVVLLIGYFFNTLTVQWLIAIPVSIMVAFCYSILITMGSDKVDPNHQGLFMGTGDALLSIAFAITAFSGGVLAIKSAVLPELVAAILFVIAWLLFPLAKKQYHAPPKSQIPNSNS
jgi:predicted MFS family arabinose efflux permease